MPYSWKPDLAIWKGSEKCIPYTDLKNNIDRKVLDDYTKRRYILHNGTPETPATAAEVGLKGIDVKPVLPPTHSEPPAALAAQDKPSAFDCTYCGCNCHKLLVCRVLQKDMREGNVRDGTVLPANFAIIEHKPRQGPPRSQDNRPRYALYDKNRRLLKRIYGLKQAPRVWYHTFVRFLESLGFIRLIKDRCVFYKIIFDAPCFIRCMSMT